MATYENDPCDAPAPRRSGFIRRNVRILRRTAVRLANLTVLPVIKRSRMLKRSVTKRVRRWRHRREVRRFNRANRAEPREENQVQQDADELADNMPPFFPILVMRLTRLARSVSKKVRKLSRRLRKKRKSDAKGKPRRPNRFRDEVMPAVGKRLRTFKRSVGKGLRKLRPRPPAAIVPTVEELEAKATTDEERLRLQIWKILAEIQVTRGAFPYDPSLSSIRDAD